MTLLKVSHLCKTYSVGGAAAAALTDVSFSLEAGARLGIVGESGSGKTTLSRILALLEQPDSGTVLLNGSPLHALSVRGRRDFYRSVQLIFQNPALYFQPRWTVLRSLCQAARNFGVEDPRGRISALARRVGLEPALLERYPHTLSGGECQRAAIIRALLPGPRLLICDEATSALDVTTGAQLLTLLQTLSREEGLALLIISHDLSVVQRLCSRTLVLQRGRIVEQGPTEQLLRAPAADYTRLLVEAAGL